MLSKLQLIAHNYLQIRSFWAEILHEAVFVHGACRQLLRIWVFTKYFLLRPKKVQNLQFFDHNYPQICSFQNKILQEAVFLDGASHQLLRIWIFLKCFLLRPKKVQNLQFFNHNHPLICSFWDEIFMQMYFNFAYVSNCLESKILPP